MINSTLCYITRGSDVLLLHRVKKENDLNHDKWIGIGGKFLENESPEECMLREAKEETGLTLTSWQYRGIVTFVSDLYEGEYMHLFTADGFDEGVLEWIPRERMDALPQWEGDRIFLNLLRDQAPFFSLKLVYEGDSLKEAALNGKPLKKTEKD